MEILPILILHSIIIYETRIYLVMKKERCMRRKKKTDREGDDRTPVDVKWEDWLSGARIGPSFPRGYWGLRVR